MASRQEILASRDLIVEVFRSFRGELLENYGAFDFERKGDASPVTECDRKIDETLKARLAGEFPNLGYKGEETGYGEVQGEYWIVDPIDGTTSFVRGVPSCVNMAAFVDGEDIVSSVIYDFVGDVLYTATKGEGAYRNGEKMNVNGFDEHFDFNMHGREVFSAVSQLLRPLDARPHHPLGASGSGLVSVADGRFDGYLHMAGRGNEHDFAPGVLLATEAGAEVFSLEDGEFSIHRVDRDFFVGTKPMAQLIRQNIDNLEKIKQKYFKYDY